MSDRPVFFSYAAIYDDVEAEADYEAVFDLQPARLAPSGLSTPP